MIRAHELTPLVLWLISMLVITLVWYWGHRTFKAMMKGLQDYSIEAQKRVWRDEQEKKKHGV